MMQQITQFSLTVGQNLKSWNRIDYYHAQNCPASNNDKENLFNNQYILLLVINSFILMTFMCKSGKLLQEEIRC